MSVPHASGYFRTSYARDMALLDTRAQRVAGSRVVLLAGAGPARSSTRRSCSISPTRCCWPSIGAVALMLLTGFAGQISLGHAGLLAAGAFTTGILVQRGARAVLGDAARRRAGRRA